MKRYLAQVFPSYFFDHPIYWQSLMLGAVYLFLLITQLFTFEDFPAVVRGYSFFGGEMTVVALAVLIPLLEATSLPYLMSMKMSARWVVLSKYAVLIAAVLWVVIAFVLTLRSTAAESGLFGATIPLSAGIWMLVYAVLLLVAAIVIVREKERAVSSSN